MNRGVYTIMAEKLNRNVQIQMNDQMLKDLDYFVDNFYFNSRSKAIRYLVNLGLRYFENSDRLI